MSESGVFLGDWAELGLQQLREDFANWGYNDQGKYVQISPVPEDIEVLVAAYTYRHYSGTAFVFFRHNGTLYEVNGSHCSCYGLEDQWNPEEVVIAELAKRPSIFGYVSDWSSSEEKAIESEIKRVVQSVADEVQA